MSRRWLVIAAIVLGVVLRVTTAHAQIVNVQGALAKPPASDGATGQVELKLNWREGNNPLFDIGGASSVIRHETQVCCVGLHPADDIASVRGGD